MDTQVISTLVSVGVGFLLGVGWDSLKEIRSTRKTRKGVRTVLFSEIKHNIRFLEKTHEDMESEQRKYKETVKPTGTGGYRCEGDPIQLLRSYHFEVLSRSAWESQMSFLSIALEEKEIESAFSFYSCLNDILVAHSEFQDFFLRDHNPGIRNVIAGQLLENVMMRIKSALEKRPSICP